MSSLPSLKLENQHALITGSAGGIGKATAELFLANGACCTLTDITKITPSLASLLKKYPGKASYFLGDLSRVKTIEKLLDSAEKEFGPVSVLFNNAALFDMAPLLESTEEMYDKLFTVNVKGMFFLMQKTLARMVRVKIKGSIINLSSQAGRRGEALVSHYCATKAAVISYTQSAALAMAPHSIRVNAIAPGVIDTPMWKQVDALFARYEHRKPGEKKKLVGQSVPLGYMGKPEQVARLALFLASSDSDYITAQTYNVDGGNVMS